MGSLNRQINGRGWRLADSSQRIYKLLPPLFTTVWNWSAEIYVISPASMNSKLNQSWLTHDQEDLDQSLLRHFYRISKTETVSRQDAKISLIIYLHSLRSGGVSRRA
jgi:hypothetical protein